MDEERLKKLLEIAPSTSEARRMVVQTENWDDAMFDQLVAFKAIELQESVVEKTIARVLTEGRNYVRVAGQVITGRVSETDTWVKETLLAMVAGGCLVGVTADDVEEYFYRRECAAALAPKGKAVVHGL